jgi:hypothetical protein
MIHSTYHEVPNVSLDESDFADYFVRMAISCAVDLDIARLRAEVQTMYPRVASNPDGDFHFHRGPKYAADRLGYDAAGACETARDGHSVVAGVGKSSPDSTIRARDLGSVQTSCWLRSAWAKLARLSGST